MIDGGERRAILVTGATGNVGAPLVGALAARGLPARAAVRSPDRARAALGEAASEVVTLDFERPETFAPALRGCRGLFLLRPPAIAKVKTTLNLLVDEAAAAGVEQVVFLSVIGADTNRFIPHHAVERHLMSSGLSWTLLRAGFFAQNLGDTYRADIRDDDRLFVPAGGGRVAFVDTRDLAEVAALAFAEPGTHREAAWPLTGPQAVTFDEAAAFLTEALGRPIRYDRAGLWSYALHLRRRGMPLAQVAVVTALNGGLALGHAEAVDPTLGSLLGRPPRGIGAYIHDHRDLWERT